MRTFVVTISFGCGEMHSWEVEGHNEEHARERAQKDIDAEFPEDGIVETVEEGTLYPRVPSGKINENIDDYYTDY